MLVTQKIDTFLKEAGRKDVVRATWDPNYNARGVLRVLQRMYCILLTDKGSDPLHPYFGTHIRRMLGSFSQDIPENLLAVQDEVRDAIRQYFVIQDQMKAQNTEDDIVEFMEVESAEYKNSDKSRINIVIKIVPRTQEAVRVAFAV